MTSSWRRSLAVGVAAAGVLAAPAASAAADANPWLDRRVLNMAHQGGEDELPSNTMYALRTSVRRGADMLELDVGVTKDARLVVLHDNTVDRTTNGSGSINDLTLRQIQRLDAAYWFVPGRNAVRGLPAARYPLRGVRTGRRRPPPGFRPADFRIPSLDEVLRAFPRTPVNVEIKGRSGNDELFLRGAELLAALLRRSGRTDVIVVSFNQAAVDRFHALAPRVPVAPGITGVASFVLGGGSPGPGVVALQVPITFTTGGTRLTITTPDLVRRAHDAGLAVHVWLSNDVEDERTYRRLLAMCADAIMAARPLALERLLARERIARPGARGEDPCTSAAASPILAPDGRTARVVVRRRGLSGERRAGSVTLRATRRTARGLPAGLTLGRARFALASGASSVEVPLRLTARARAALRRGAVRAAATTTDRHGAPLRRPVVLRLAGPQ
jgi:glycerophosphoryl diester phosphodiesterase